MVQAHQFSGSLFPVPSVIQRISLAIQTLETCSREAEFWLSMQTPGEAMLRPANWAPEGFLVKLGHISSLPTRPSSSFCTFSYDSLVALGGLWKLWLV